MKYGGSLPGGLPRRDSLRANLILSHLNAIATDDEKISLRDPGVESGIKRALVKKLHGFLLKRLKGCFALKQMEIPRKLDKPGYVLPFSALESIIGKLKKENAAPDLLGYAAFRKGVKEIEANKRALEVSKENLDKPSGFAFL